MANLISTCVSISNKLRFKSKFTLLTFIFYVPLLAMGTWIVSEQSSKISLYEKELVGLKAVTVAGQFEQSIRGASTTKPSVELINDLSEVASSVDWLSNLDGQVRALKSDWQGDIDDYQYHVRIYQHSMSIRENVAAKSGLIRESNASAYYLSELTVTRLPELIEYISRTGELTTNIINSGGFNADSYTLLVALEQRLDELQTQVAKSFEKLLLEEVTSHTKLNTLSALLLSEVDEYQDKLKSQVISPDNIMWSTNDTERYTQVLHQVATDMLALTSSTLQNNIDDYRVSSQQTLLIVSIVLALGIVVSAFVLIVIYTSLKRNVIAINEASDRLGQGDFSTELVIESADEFGDIATSFVQMQRKISALLNILSADVVKLNVSATDIHQLTDEMEENLAKQQSGVHSVAGAITQLSASAAIISQNTQTASELTEQASAHVSSGQSVISDTATAINDISTEVNASADVINELAGHSDDIGQFVNVIREIADQTNLLALNAAIEAARAGEQGRGFAVVADEVRTLASRTQDATTSIQRIIIQLQEGTSKSVDAMNQGVDKAKHGVVQADNVAQTFTEVTQNVDDIVNATVQISGAVSEQTHMIGDIENNTTDIAGGADNLIEAAKNAAGAGQNLSQLADQLSEQLSQFKLNKDSA